MRYLRVPVAGPKVPRQAMCFPEYPYLVVFERKYSTGSILGDYLGRCSGIYWSLDVDLGMAEQPDTYD